MLISDAAKGVCTYSSCLCDSLPHNHLNAIREATLEAPMLPRDFPEPHASRHFALCCFSHCATVSAQMCNVGILQGACVLRLCRCVPLRISPVQ